MKVYIDDLYRSGADGNLDIIGIYEDDELSGFFAVRKFGKMCYMAYFAVCEGKRSKGTGSKAPGLLRNFYPDSVIVTEFKTPDSSYTDNNIHMRRRNFYLRNGFSETGWYTVYDGTEFEVACTGEFDSGKFERFTGYIRTIVSDHIPVLYRRKYKTEL